MQLLLLVTVHELLYATCRVDEHVFAGVEGVRRAANFKLDNRIRLAVLHRDGLVRGHRRASYEFKSARSVLKHDFAILGMYVFFHGLMPFLPSVPADFAEGTAKVHVSLEN